MPAVDQSLKVFAIANRTNSSGTTQDDVDQEELRSLVGATLLSGYTRNLTSRAANPNAFQVRQDTGSNMQIKVGSGTTKVDGYVVAGTVAGQGSYLFRLDATTITVTVPAADTVNPRKYGVYAWVDDASYSGTASRRYAGISCLAGTPAGSPVTPSPSAVWSAYALLWEFQLAANATAVTNTILDNATTNDKRRPTVSANSAGHNVLYARQSASQTGIGTSANYHDLTSLSGSFVARSDRLYEAVMTVRVLQNTSTGQPSIRIRTGTSGTGSEMTPDGILNSGWSLTAGSVATFTCQGYITGDGPVTLHGQARTTAGTIDTSGGSFACHLYVRDLGFA